MPVDTNALPADLCDQCPPIKTAQTVLLALQTCHARSRIDDSKSKIVQVLISLQTRIKFMVNMTRTALNYCGSVSSFFIKFST